MNRRRDGFTLIELMIVVTIMGSMAAMIAPGLIEFVSDIRASGAAEDLVRMSRHMRSRVQETGLAHMLVYSGADNVSGGLGRIDVYEGMTNHCRETPWAQAIGGVIANGFATVDVVDMGDTSYNAPIPGSIARKGDTGRHVITVTVRGNLAGPTAAVICYEPGGATFEGVAALGNFAFTPQTQAITFTVTRTVSGEQHGPTRDVVFPAGAAARFRF